MPIVSIILRTKPNSRAKFTSQSNQL